MSAGAHGSGWLGLDIGGTKILGVSVSDGGRIRQTVRVETRRDEGPEAVLRRAVDVCRSLLTREGDAGGLGVGFAGLVDGSRGAVLSSIMLPGWEGFPLADRLSHALGGLAVLVENDATAAGYGEHIALGSPPGLNMVLLTVGTGIGGAILIDGRIYRGARGTAAEFGNMTIDWTGERCWCGSRGCLNMLASGSAISGAAARMAARDGESALAGLPEPIPVERIAAAAHAGDAVAARALEDGARALWAGIANLINIFNPDRVAIAGGLSSLGRAYLRPVRDEAMRRAFDESAAHARVELAVAGAAAGALGAAGLIRDRLRKAGGSAMRGAGAKQREDMR